MSNSLDSPYPSNYLEALREQLHKSIVKKYAHYLQRSDYVVYFDESAPVDSIYYQSGKVLHIKLGCSPTDLQKVKLLSTQAFQMPRLRELLRYHGLIRSKDAIALYGIKLDNMGNPIPTRSRVHRYTTKIEVLVTVTMYDKETGRQVTITQKNGNAFSAQEEAYKILYKDS